MRDITIKFRCDIPLCVKNGKCKTRYKCDGADENGMCIETPVLAAHCRTCPRNYYICPHLIMEAV